MIPSALDRLLDVARLLLEGELGRLDPDDLEAVAVIAWRTGPSRNGSVRMQLMHV